MEVYTLLLKLNIDERWGEKWKDEGDFILEQRYYLSASKICFCQRTLNPLGGSVEK